MRRKHTRFAIRCWRAFYSVCITLIVLAGLTFLFLRSGISSDLLRDEAENRLQQILGPNAGVEISQAQVSLDSNRYLALEARDVTIKSSIKDISIEKLGVIKLGLAPLPLLSGSVQVAQIDISDAVMRFEQDKISTKPLFKMPFDERGLVDFDLVSHEVFTGIDQTLALLDMRSTEAISLQDVTFIFHAMGKNHQVVISDAQISQSGKNVDLQATFVWQGQSSDLTAHIVRSESLDQKSASSFSLSVNNMPVSLGSSPVVIQRIGGDRPNPAYFHLSSLASFSLSGNVANADNAETLSGKLVFNDTNVDMGRERGLKGNIAVAFEHVAGANKLEIQSLEYALGGFRAVFEGALGTEPETHDATVTQLIVEDTASDIAKKAAYRFELVSRSAVSDAENSGEAPVSFGVKAAGRLMQDASRIDFAELNVKTDSGELYGQGRMIFGQGSPAMIFLLRIPSMPVAHAKQLWPMNVADGARDWVLKNLFGGQLKDGRIDIALPAGHFNGPGLPPDLTESDVKIDFTIEDTRFDVIGDLPPVRDASGTIAVRGAHTTIKLDKGSAFTAGDRRIDIDGGTLFIPWGRQRPVIADLDLNLNGQASAMTELVGYKPINALSKLPFAPEELSGDVSAKVKVSFGITKNAPKDSLVWQADVAFDKLALSKPFDGQIVTQAKGNLSVNKNVARITASARLNNIPAQLSLVEPLEDKNIKRQQSVVLQLDEKTRETYYPALNDVFKGPLTLDLGEAQNDMRKISADLTKTTVTLPWLGWKKGAGIPAKLTIDMKASKDNKGQFSIRNFVFSGTGFNVSGDAVIHNNQLHTASIKKLNLTRNDKLSMEVRRSGNGYRADVRGTAFDARALIQQTSTGDATAKKDLQRSSGTIPRIVVNAQIDEVKGFYDESLRNVTISYETAGSKVSGGSLNAVAGNGAQVNATSSNQKDASSLSLNSTNAGAVLRFFDLYDKMQGGKITVNLTSQGTGPLYGNIDARDFSIINEPRLAKVVSSGSNGGKSLNQAVRKSIDVSRVDFDRGFAQVEKGTGYLTVKNGILRGPLIGATFQGILYDRNGNMSITGTFMPAYGLNRLFADLPLLGAILGNGRDRGLIGITYKLSGNAKHPNIIVNPISVIAPGIFRSIFEFQ